MQRNSIFRFLFILFIGLITTPVITHAQADQNWWFGNGARGIQFQQPGDTARLVTRATSGITGIGTVGGAVASDVSTGALLFYTDGNTVYDATHRAMPSSSGLTGNASGSQPAVITRVPGTTNQYYVITNSATTTTAGSLSSSIVDMTLQGNNTSPAPPLGDVGAQKNVAIAGLTNESEGMIAIKNLNGEDYWLVTKEAGTTNFKVTSITDGGITPGVAETPNGLLIPFTAAHFAFDSINNKLAVAPTEPNKNVMIFDFNQRTGALTFDRAINNSAVTANLTRPVIYDLEWSNNGEYLYVSRQGDAGTPGLLLQYNLTTTNAMVDTVDVPSMVRSYGLQMGPDSSVYHLYQTAANGPFLLGRVTDPDTTANEVNYETGVFNNASFGGSQFPSSIVAHPVEPTISFTTSGDCANSPTSFFPSVDPAADSLKWEFGDDTQSMTWAPTHTYTEGGSFPVRLVAYFGEDSVDVTQNVDITQFDLQISLVQDTIACSCELLFPKNTDAPDTYGNGQPCQPFALTATASGATGAINWFGPRGNLGINSLTLTPVDSAGYYYVTVADPNGTSCVATAGVNIQEYNVEDPRANMWFFGNNAGIDFNQYPPDDLNPDPIQGPATSAEGIATISDQNGQEIFTTNGEQVWDRNGNPLITPPPGLGGSQNATQSSFIIPFPNDPTMYYIFTTQEVYPSTTPGYELRYSIFDLKVGDGQLIDANGPDPGVSAVLFTKSTERLTGNEGWLIAHEYGNNNFRAYPITGEGIGAPVISSIGSDHSLAVREHAEGYMKLTGANIAVALSTPGVSNVVELFDFDNTTGAVTNFRQIDLEQPNGQVYGVEIVGNRLFASTKFSTSAPGSSLLYEFVQDTINNTYVKKAGIPPTVATGELGAIQTGPDGQVYVAVNNSGALGVIQPGGDFVTPSQFDEAGFPLTPTVPPGPLSPTSTLGLPNFIQSINNALQNPTIAVTGACEDVELTFTGSGTSVIDTLIWDFGDGERMEGAALNEVTHTYSEPGNYLVTLTIRNRCVGQVGDALDTLITIHPTPIALSGATTLCQGDEQIEATPLTNPDLATLTFAWSTGQTERAITPPAQGIYNVTVTSEAGCTADGEWFVSDNRPQVELGPDLTLCEGQGGPQFDFTGQGTEYQWRRNEEVISDEPAIRITTGLPGNVTEPRSFEYEIFVRDEFTGCEITDSAVYLINPRPEWEAATVPPSACGAPDGEINLTIENPPGSYSYTVDGPTPVNSATDIEAPTTIAITGLSAGAYNLTVANQVTGCSTSETVGLSDDEDFTVSIERAADCGDDIPVLITLTGSSIPTTWNYRIYSFVPTDVEISGTHEQNPTNNPTNPANPPGVPRNGRYVAEITTNSSPACVVLSEPTRIEERFDRVEFDRFEIEECQLPTTVRVISPNALTYLWTGPGLETPPGNDQDNISVSPAPGFHDYSLAVTGDPLSTCPNDTTITVNVANQPPATLTQSNPCDENVILTAGPEGNYSYRWNGVPNSGGQQISVTPDNNGQTFTVEARNNETGCIVSAELTVAVLGILTVDLEVPPTCEGLPYTLVANTTQPTATISWSYNNEVIPNETTTNLLISDDREGLFKVRVENSAAGQTCFDEDEASVIVNPTTPGNLPETGIICPSETNLDEETKTVTLNPGEGFRRYSWLYEGDSLNIYTPTLVADRSGTYSVALINQFNCPSTDEITLTEECDPQITGPNAFRPSGTNKEFFLFTFFIDETSFEIFIFNRWGEMVFYDDDPAFRWNGGYKNNINQPLPPGTYSYVVKYRSSYRPEMGIEELRGGVVLIR